MKKFFSLFLAAVLLLAVVPANGFAAEEEHAEGTQAHVHLLPTSDTSTVRRGWAYYNADYHVHKYMNTCVCVTCGETVIWFTKGAYPETRKAHNYVRLSATCDGSMQTHIKECPDCLHRLSTKVKCPGAPHSGACGYLPV